MEARSQKKNARTKTTPGDENGSEVLSYEH